MMKTEEDERITRFLQGPRPLKFFIPSKYWICEGQSASQICKYIADLLDY